MVDKKRKNRKRPMTPQEGGAFLDTLKNIAGKTNDFLKQTKLLSTVAQIIPPTVPYIGKPAQILGPILKQAGYGQDIVGVPNLAIGGQRVSKPIGMQSVQTGGAKKMAKKAISV